MKLKITLATLVGIVSGMLVIGLVEALGHQLFPVPQEVTQAYENQDTEALLALISPAMLFFVLLAYLLGSFVAGSLSAWIAKSKKPAWIAGAVLTLGGFLNVTMIPHPLWFILLSLVVYLPFALLGARFSHYLMYKNPKKH